MANKRKPDNLHLLQGTYKPSIHGDPKKKPNIKAKMPTMPDWLDQYAQKEWERITNVLKSANMLTEADQGILTQYCVLHGEMEYSYIPDEDGNMKPFSTAGHTQLRMCSIELGLTPSARSKITVEPDETPEY